MEPKCVSWECRKLFPICFGMEGRIFQGRVRAGNCRVRITMHVRQHSRLLKRKREGGRGGCWWKWQWWKFGSNSREFTIFFHHSLLYVKLCALKGTYWNHWNHLHILYCYVMPHLFCWIRSSAFITMWWLYSQCHHKVTLIPLTFA